MKVILLTDVPKVGNRYDVKDFKQGYAQNVLIAKGLAILATPHELAKLADRKSSMDRKKLEDKESFKNFITTLSDKKITIKVRANEKGHLFKSVGAHDVAMAIKESTGIEINEDNLRMTPIKEIGFHTITIKKGDIEGKCPINIEIQK